eukprot:6611230-Pyramimonas_sp.AAC.1
MACVSGGPVINEVILSGDIYIRARQYGIYANVDAQVTQWHSDTVARTEPEQDLDHQWEGGVDPERLHARARVLVDAQVRGQRQGVATSPGVAPSAPSGRLPRVPCHGGLAP